MATKKLTLAAVNKALRERGVAEELVKGDGYFYFWGDKASNWPRTAVYVNQLNQLSLEQWLFEYEDLSGEKLVVQTTPKTEPPTELKTEQFPLLLSALTERRQRQFETAIAAINEALQAKAIPNPLFKESKEWLDRCVDDAAEKHCGTDYYHLTDGHFVSGLHSCKAEIKRARALKASGPIVDTINAFFNEVEPLVLAVDAVKPYVVKRVVKTAEQKQAEEEAAYTPPRASMTAERAVYDVLQAITEKHYAGLVDSFKGQFQRTVKLFLESGEQVRRQIHRDPWRNVAVSRATEPKRLAGHQEYALLPDADVRLQELAEQLASDSQKQFVFKNLRKLASIVERRGDFDRIEEVSGSVNLTGLTGAVRAHFKDGSSFVANNSVVWQTSVHGKPYQRFPLTFHDVVMADGTKISHPSEQKMNEIFAGGIERDPLELAQDAQGRFTEGEEGHLAAEKARWTREDAFPIDKLGDLQELKDFFTLECAKAEEEGRDYRDMVGQSMETPVVVLLRHGNPYIWDGELQVAAAAANGRSTIPAIVGVPLDELTQEKAPAPRRSDSPEP